MTKTYTITLTPAEDKALSVTCMDNEEWINHAIHERCRIAIEEVVQYEVQRLLADGKQIPTTKDEIVLGSDIETATERDARMREELKRVQEQQG